MPPKHLIKAAFYLHCACILTTAVAAQDQSFPDWERYPGLHVTLVQPTFLWETGVLSVDRTVVRDHVHGLHALKLTFNATKGAAGIVVYRPPGAVVADVGVERALSFWVKGDGSSGRGVIGIGTGGDADPRATFRLRSKTWQPVRLTWSDFDPPVTATRIPSLFFGVTPDTKRPVAYIVDHLKLARAADAAADEDEIRKLGAAAAKLKDPPFPKDLSPFATHRGKLATVRAHIQEKQGIALLVIGDGVTQGGLWNVPTGARSRFLYWGRLAKALENAGAKPVVTYTVVVPRPADAASRIAPLLRRYRPNVVIVQFSTSGVGAGLHNLRTHARTADRAIFETCRKAGVPVIAVGVPPIASALKRVDEAQTLLAEAARAGVPAVDFGKVVSVRARVIPPKRHGDDLSPGKGFEAQYYATHELLNVQGHLLLSQVLTSLMVEP